MTTGKISVTTRPTTKGVKRREKPAAQPEQLALAHDDRHFLESRTHWVCHNRECQRLWPAQIMKCEDCSAPKAEAFRRALRSDLSRLMLIWPDSPAEFIAIVDAWMLKTREHFLGNAAGEGGDRIPASFDPGREIDRLEVLNGEIRMRWPLDVPLTQLTEWFRVKFDMTPQEEEQCKGGGSRG